MTSLLKEKYVCIYVYILQLIFLECGTLTEWKPNVPWKLLPIHSLSDNNVMGLHDYVQKCLASVDLKSGIQTVNSTCLYFFKW